MNPSGDSRCVSAPSLGMNLNNKVILITGASDGIGRDA